MQEKPWGKLTGVRPSKLLHRMLDQGLNRDDAFHFMLREYHVQYDKFALLWQVCQKERAILTHSTHSNLFSIYVGIPFCPTRCLYCSFPSHSLTELDRLREPFVKSLLFEIKETGKLTRHLGMAPYTVYLGGGTPTALSPLELEQILNALKDAFPGVWREFTVEAGRPDTITHEHLQIMQKLGVDRISVNPQSMHDDTLKKIGRCHDTDDIRTAAALVRQVGIPILNMDLIIGLTGENTMMVEESVRQTLAIKPENITVHIFSRKRASRFSEDKDSYILPGAAEIADMQRSVFELLLPAYQPYYLYRQRDILGGLENIGFAVPGSECVYNIIMIEERHHILGLGVGATSKMLNPDFTLKNIPSPKDVQIYLARQEQTLAKRADMLRETQKKWQKPSS